MFLSFDIANIISAACKGWGLHNEDFFVIRGCVLMPSLHIKSIGLMPLFHVVVRFLLCCCKKVVQCAGTSGGVLGIAFVLLRFSRYYSCLSRFQVSLGFFLALLSAS